MRSPVTTRVRLCITALALALAWPGLLAAQYDDVPAPAAYAVRGATVVTPDGGRREGVTIIVRGHFIEAMGPDVTIPADAEVLEGDSLFVYPGIVDAHGAADFEFPEEEVDRSKVASWAPPRSLQGYTPHRRVVDALTATGEDLDDQRREGIVAAAVHPGDALMPGRGTLLLYRTDATQPEELVVDPVLGPTFTFKPGRRVYPSTLFGVMAFMRQKFADAARQREIRARFAEDVRGITQPRWDPDLAVLQQVMRGEDPVFFHANSAEDIRRALGLADELGFRPVIVGGGEAWKVAELLREREVPVLVSLDFPEPKRWDPDAEEDEPLDAAALDEKQELEALYANAGRLAEAGVTFALTSGGEGDILDGVRKAVAYGLDDDAALRALTATPAELLGVPHLARIEEGRTATFVVADGPLFDENSTVLYTFVEGGLEKASTRTAADKPPAVDVTGTWSIELTVEGQSLAGTLTLTQDGGAFEGELETPMGSSSIIDGVVSGNELRFTLVMDTGGETAHGSFTGTVEGDEATGSGSTPFGSVSWSAERTSGPEGGAVR